MPYSQFTRAVYYFLKFVKRHYTRTRKTERRNNNHSTADGSFSQPSRTLKPLGYIIQRLITRRVAVAWAHTLAKIKCASFIKLGRLYTPTLSLPPSFLSSRHHRSRHFHLRFVLFLSRSDRAAQLFKCRITAGRGLDRWRINVRASR